VRQRFDTTWAPGAGQLWVRGSQRVRGGVPAVEREAARVLVDVGVEARGDVQRVNGARDWLVKRQQRPRCSGTS
jgi:hypothetical protein